MAKNDKEAAAPADQAAPKGKSKILIIIIVVLVAALGGVGAMFFLKSGHDDKGKEAAKEKTHFLEQAKFVPLERFTVNLQREEGDQYLQIGISLKIFDPEMEDKIKANMPEIRSKLLMVLSAKKASELATVEGKKALANQIVMTSNAILGIKKRTKKSAPEPVAVPKHDEVAASSPSAEESDSADTEDEKKPAKHAAVDGEEENADAHDTEEVDAEAAAEERRQREKEERMKGIVDVMFTDFIIQ